MKEEAIMKDALAGTVERAEHRHIMALKGEV